jgi:GNAT superfamily N-acetyltransferase
MVEFRDERLDGDAGTELLGAFEAEVAALYPGWTPTSGPTVAPDEFVAPAGLFLVGYDGEVPVMCGGFKRLSVTEVKRLYVVPEARGTGLAGVLLDTLESRARRVSYDRVRLDTGDDQPTALRLYRTRGYVEIDDYNANPFASHWFEKRV